MSNRDMENAQIFNKNRLRTLSIDYSKANAFIEQTEKRSNRSVAEAKKRGIEKNLAEWDASLAMSWKNARMNNITDEHAKQQALDILKNKDASNYSCLIKGPENSGKTFMAYSYVRSLIGRGKTSAERILFISEKEIYLNATNGFHGSNFFSDIFKKSYNTFVLEDMGNATVYSPKECAFYEILFNNVSIHDANLIVTCSNSLDIFLDSLDKSGKTKFNSIIGDNVVSLSRSFEQKNVEGYIDEVQEKKRMKEIEKVQNRFNTFK